VGSNGLVSVVNADEDKAYVFGDYFAGVYTHEPAGDEFNALPSIDAQQTHVKNVTFSEEVILHCRRRTDQPIAFARQRQSAPYLTNDWALASLSPSSQTPSRSVQHFCGAHERGQHRQKDAQT